MKRTAVIFAGGKGTRLAPFTFVLPKPLMPVGDLPIIEIVMRQLKRNGFEGVTLAVGHLASLVRAYFDGHPIANHVNLTYFQENEPLGTVGALGLIKGLTHPFLAMNGDILTTLNYGELFDYHVASNAALTVAVTKKRVNIELGVLDLDASDRVTGYTEKPTKEYPASMGIYVYDPKVISYIEPGKYLDVPTLVLRLIEKGEKVQAYVPDVFWLDMGNRGDYERATAEFDAHRDSFLPDER